MNVKSASVPLSSVPLPEELPSCQESAEEWAIDTDLSLTGRVKRHWLERKGESLLVLEETADGRALVIEVPIAGVEGARTVSGVGCGLLQIKQGGAWIDLLGFSNALAERFHKIAQRIENEVNPRSTASFPSSP